MVNFRPRIGNEDAVFQDVRIVAALPNSLRGVPADAEPTPPRFPNRRMPDMLRCLAGA